MAFFALETAREMSLSSRPSPGRSSKSKRAVQIRSLDPGLRRDDDPGVARDSGETTSPPEHAGANPSLLLLRTRQQRQERFQPLRSATDGAFAEIHPPHA
jgi:hypothetical protein